MHRLCSLIYIHLLLLMYYTVSCIEVLPPCTDPDYSYIGYTYTVRNDGVRTWTHCKFINPHVDMDRCGVSEIWNGVYVCDPDHLLVNEEPSDEEPANEGRENEEPEISYPGKFIPNKKQ